MTDSSLDPLLLRTYKFFKYTKACNFFSSCLQQSFSTTPRSANSTLNLTGTEEKERQHLSPKVPGAENVKAKDVSWDEDSENEEEEETEDGEDEEKDEETDESDTEVDEYEDELREIAESHEAMAKDQRGNGILNTTNSTNSVSKNQSFPSTSFASPEKNDGIMSDESSGSKGPVADDDEEVKSSKNLVPTIRRC